MESLRGQGLVLVFFWALGMGAFADTVTVGTGCTFENALASVLPNTPGSKGSCKTSTSSSISISLPAGEVDLTQTAVLNTSISISGAGALSNSDSTKGTIGSLGANETRIVAPAGQRAFVILPSTTTVNSGVSNTTANVVSLSALSIVGGTATDDCTSALGLAAVGGHNGGAICNGGQLSLSNVEVRGASAQDEGGGLYSAAGSTLSLGTTSFLGNSVLSAQGNGAAIYLNHAALTVNAATFYAQCDPQAPAPNTAPASCPGGAQTFVLADVGAFVSGSSGNNVAQLADLTISGNLAAGLYDETDLSLLNSDIVNNLAGFVLNPGMGKSSTGALPVGITDSIIADNIDAGGQESDCQNANVNNTAMTFSLVTDQGGCPLGAQTASGSLGFEATDINMNVVLAQSGAPEQSLIEAAGGGVAAPGILAPLGNYGGNLLTHKPRYLLSYNARTDSPVMGRGLGCGSADARGDKSAACDIGADFYQFPVSGNLSLTGIQGQPVSSSNLTSQLGDSDLLPYDGAGSQWTCLYVYQNTSLTQQAQSTAPGCAWVVPDSMTGTSPATETTNTRGSVAFSATQDTLTYTPNQKFYGTANFEVRLTTTSSMLNPDPNDRFITETVLVSEQPASGLTSQTLSGAMDGTALTGLLLTAWISIRRRRQGGRS